MAIDPMRRWWDTVVPSPIPGETRLQKMRREKAEKAERENEPTLEPNCLPEKTEETSESSSQKGSLFERVEKLRR